MSRNLQAWVSGKTEVKLEILTHALGAKNTAEGMRRCIKALYLLHSQGRVDLSTLLLEGDTPCQDAQRNEPLEEFLFPSHQVDETPD